VAPPTPTPSAVIVAPGALVPDSDGGGAPKPVASIAPECVAVEEGWASTNRALENLSEDHPRALVGSFLDAAAAMADVDAQAQGFSALAGDWSAFAGYLDRVNVALADVDADDAQAVTAARQAAVSNADTQDAVAHSAAITAFLSAGCDP
jgi:hypothetical protein